MNRDVIDCNGLDQFQTQQASMKGSWYMFGEEKKRESIRILVREAHKCRYE